MKGQSHILLTSSMAFALTLNPFYAIGAAASTHGPDWLDSKIPTSQHRNSFSHGLVPWFAVAFCPFLIGINWDYLLLAFLAGAMAGPFFHILVDAGSYQGVPFLPGLQFRLKLYKTGRGSEIFWLCVGLALVWYLCYLKLITTSNH